MLRFWIPGIYGKYIVAAALPLLSRMPILFTMIGFGCREKNNKSSIFTGIIKPFGNKIPGTLPRESTAKYAAPGFRGAFTWRFIIPPGIRVPV